METRYDSNGVPLGGTRYDSNRGKVSAILGEIRMVNVHILE